MRENGPKLYAALSQAAIKPRLQRWNAFLKEVGNAFPGPGDLLNLWNFPTSHLVLLSEDSAARRPYLHQVQNRLYGRFNGFPGRATRCGRFSVSSGLSSSDIPRCARTRDASTFFLPLISSNSFRSARCIPTVSCSFINLSVCRVRRDMSLCVTGKYTAHFPHSDNPRIDHFINIRRPIYRVSNKRIRAWIC